MGPPRPGHGPPGRLLLLAWLSFGCAHISSAQGATREPRHWRQLGRGEWTPWGAWSACSSTCGDGVALRTRRCLRFAGEELCEGEPRRYRVCQLHACPSGSVPFRAMQCALYNSKPILGKPARYHWVPFYGAPNLCDLNCLATGHNFYYTFGRVLDGTRCSPDAPELCISGQCLRAGCDGILGSGAQRDACGQCGGRNESCVLVQRVFRAAFPSSGYFGYKNVTRIPAGAMHIRVTDRSRNYLALMTAEQHYVINGDWAVDPPGVYEVAGTQVHYTRTADERESLEAAGPTREDLYVTVLFQEPNPGIEYEFWLPRGRDGHFQADVSPLRQPQPREAHMDPPRQPPPVPQTTPVPTPPSTRATGTRRLPGRTKEVAQTGRCGRCPMPKGRSKRIHHYCHSDFVFQARILSQRLVGQETRYEVQVQQVYHSGSPLLRREYVWAPDTCGCPPLRPRHDYVLMAQRHVNYEHTLNRLLLPPGAYARPWSPREDWHLRDAARHCPPARPA